MLLFGCGSNLPSGDFGQFGVCDDQIKRLLIQEPAGFIAVSNTNHFISVQSQHGLAQFRKLLVIFYQEDAARLYFFLHRRLTVPGQYCALPGVPDVLVVVANGLLGNEAQNGCPREDDSLP